MKKILITPLLTMLLVGCQLVIVTPSSSLSTSTQASSSSDSNSTTSSTTNSSSTITTSSSSNTGTSSNPTSSSGTSTSSGSSSEEPINTRKVPFNQIGSLVAQVVDAKAMGIVNSKDRAPLNGRRNAQGEDQNYMVKVTETYNPNTQITEDETVQVTFSRVTNTQTTELQTGTESYVASAEPVTIERITDLPGNVVITNVPGYEFRALNGDVVLQDWTSSDQPTIEFLFERLESGTFNKVANAQALDIVPITNDPGNIVIANNPEYEFRLMDGEVEVIPWQTYTTTNVEFIFNSEITNPTIEYRGINALITFESISNLIYDISFDGQTIIEGLVDNGPTDLDSDLGTISINGLTQGFTYEVSYTGEIPNQDLTNITIESRSLNASISFIAFDGFTYTIKQGETIIYEGIEDNDEPDTNEAVGNITLFGLTEGLTYDVTYAGYRVIETITQDEVEGQVDKLYVLYQYTFISFVPLNLNNRPQDQDLELDYDDVPLYDKQGYFSDSTRQSFVVDNDTGLIYKIENINIASLSGGCVAVQDSPFPFDLKINLNNELEFYSLHQNSTIQAFSCFKDKFGQKFINNDKVNTFITDSKTTFFVYDNFNLLNKDILFLPASNGNAIKIQQQFDRNYSGMLSDVKIVIENGDIINLNENDTFDIYYNFSNSINSVHKVIKGIVLGSEKYQNRGYSSQWHSQNLFYFFDSLSSKEYGFYHNFETLLINMEEFANEELILLYYNESILFLTLEEIIEVIKNIASPGYVFFQFQSTIDILMEKSLNVRDYVLKNVVVEKNNQPQGMGKDLISRFGLNGNTYFDLIPEYVDGKWSIVPYISGTYVAPPITSVTLQPINR